MDVATSRNSNILSDACDLITIKMEHLMAFIDKYTKQATRNQDPGILSGIEPNKISIG